MPYLGGCHLSIVGCTKVIKMIWVGSWPFLAGPQATRGCQTLPDWLICESVLNRSGMIGPVGSGQMWPLGLGYIMNVTWTTRN